MIFELSAVAFALITLAWLTGLEAQLHDLKTEVGQLRNTVKKLEAVTSYDLQLQLVTCNTCNGMGKLITKNKDTWNTCSGCKGTGLVQKDATSR